jgi:hypothetical protein
LVALPTIDGTDILLRPAIRRQRDGNVYTVVRVKLTNGRTL